jgi:hypothetical protein
MMVPTAKVEMIVPTNANMQIAPKFLKKVLCKIGLQEISFQNWKHGVESFRFVP